MQRVFGVFLEHAQRHILFAVVGLVLSLSAACANAPVTDIPDNAPLAGQRLLPLSGTDNARDVGGYKTTDGRMVRWGVLYRADSLADLTDEDVAYLGTLNLAAVTDFRSQSERDEAPDRLPRVSPAIEYRTLDVTNPAMDVAELGRQVLFGQLSETELLLLTDRTGYVDNPKLIRMWGQWVASLADERNLPHLFHCTAGKDRTGFAAAMVLLTLGVPQEQVMEDFLLSNEYLGAKIAADIDRIRAHSDNEIDETVLRQVLGVTPRSLEGALEAMEAKYGSVDGFIAHGLGIDTVTRSKLKNLLLE